MSFPISFPYGKKKKKNPAPIVTVWHSKDIFSFHSYLAEKPPMSSSEVNFLNFRRQSHALTIREWNLWNITSRKVNSKILFHTLTHQKTRCKKKKKIQYLKIILSHGEYEFSQMTYTPSPNLLPNTNLFSDTIDNASVLYKLLTDVFTTTYAFVSLATIMIKMKTIRHQSEEPGKLWECNEPCRDLRDKQAINIHCLLRTWSFTLQETS